MVAGMLITQDSDYPAAAEESYCFLKAFASVKKLNAKTGALLPDKSIQIGVSELLIDRTHSGVCEILWQYLRKQFPVTEMTERQHHWSACAQFLMYHLCTFDRDQRHHLR